MPDEAPPALKEMFNAARYRQIAGLLAEAQPGFDRKRFLAVALHSLDGLTLLQRVRRATAAAHATLPGEFPKALAVLKRIAPRMPDGFVGIFLPDFVGQHGHGHFDDSMVALKYFTPFSSAEFAVREFLRRDLTRTLAVMEHWARDENEHVRRLASEGCRPRLPWSFRLDALMADPSPVAPILDHLRADPSLYVRKSVANHLNDISKDHPDWMLARLQLWSLAHPHTLWIAKRAARTLIKAGHQPALRLFHFGGRPAVKLSGFKLAPPRPRLGQRIEFSFGLTSTSRQAQRLAIDYRIHYVKANGRMAPKVFKLREITLAAGASVAVAKAQRLQDFTTRRHYAGRHRLEVQINGRVLAGAEFELRV